MQRLACQLWTVQQRLVDDCHVQYPIIESELVDLATYAKLQAY
jgi:hypothetical protein